MRCYVCLAALGKAAEWRMAVGALINGILCGLPLLRELRMSALRTDCSDFAATALTDVRQLIVFG